MILPFITAGRATTNTQSTADEAQRVKDDYITLVTVGVGSNVDENLLRRMSSPPQTKGLFYHILSNVDALISVSVHSVHVIAILGHSTFSHWTQIRLGSP